MNVEAEHKTVQYLTHQYLWKLTHDLWLSFSKLNHTTGTYKRNKLVLTIHYIVTIMSRMPQNDKLWNASDSQNDIASKIKIQDRKQSGITGMKAH